ncbi:class II aldolase/adducin family protein [uncultured Cohaesibacter sp.]|uniref:class II aldolase/adducin family protein n=1 Tax=uncultured Cohaesibacter sp. TaxID=1002546 RepID=UPI00292F82D6|nr:class II aldolase/adducin family protein [uncultured Cohaesibacter sp.]
MNPRERALRSEIIDKANWMNDSGLNQGTSGNISARFEDRMLITPSGIPYDTLEPESICSMPLEGEYGAWDGPFKPSTEWRFHLDITKERPDVGAIIHTHSTYAATLAMARKSIPAAHYMVAIFGGDSVRCSGYATYGTKKLSEMALEALEGRCACLLANHGLLVAGSSLDKSAWLAVELETLCRQYYQTLTIGGPVILTKEDIDDVMKSIATYGLQDKE